MLRLVATAAGDNIGQHQQGSVAGAQVRLHKEMDMIILVPNNKGPNAASVAKAGTGPDVFQSNFCKSKAIYGN